VDWETFDIFVEMSGFQADDDCNIVASMSGLGSKLRLEISIVHFCS